MPGNNPVLELIIIGSVILLGFSKSSFGCSIASRALFIMVPQVRAAQELPVAFVRSSHLRFESGTSLSPPDAGGY